MISFLFSIVHQTWSSMNTVILINTRIFEFDSWDDWTETYSRIWSKVSNDEDSRCLNSFIVKQWRRFSMFEFVHCCKSRAIQMKQKLIIFDMSRRHWHDEKRVLWHDSCLYVSSNLIEKSSFVQNNFLIEHLMWNASWNQYENIVNRIKTKKKKRRSCETNFWSNTLIKASQNICDQIKNEMIYRTSNMIFRF